MARYRKRIFGTLLEAIEQGRIKDYGGMAADARKVLAAGAQLAKPGLLRYRERHLSDGVILESELYGCGVSGAVR